MVLQVLLREVEQVMVLQVLLREVEQVRVLQVLLREVEPVLVLQVLLREVEQVMTLSTLFKRRWNRLLFFRSMIRKEEHGLALLVLCFCDIFKKRGGPGHDSSGPWLRKKDHGMHGYSSLFSVFCKGTNVRVKCPFPSNIII